ncbi:MAG: hypothetical protein AAF689_13550 [Pseudomonadota bacterium]
MFIAYRRQRRRIAATMILATVALLVGFIGQAGWLMRLMYAFGGPSFLTGLQTAATVLTAGFMIMLIVLRFAPAQRQQCEVIAGSTLIFELFNFALGWIGAPFASPLLAVCAFVLLCLFVDHVVYGRTLDLFGPWRPLAASHSFAVKATPNAAWNAIVPRPDTVSTHWIGALTEVSHTREPDVFVARYRLGDGTILQKSLTVLAEEHPVHMRYHFEPEADDDESRFGSGFYEVWLDPQDDGHEVTQITITCEYTALRTRTALLLWFDDWLGSEGDAIAAFIERRPDRSLHTRLWGEVLRQAA